MRGEAVPGEHEAGVIRDTTLKKKGKERGDEMKFERRDEKPQLKSEELIRNGATTEDDLF